MDHEYEIHVHRFIKKIPNKPDLRNIYKDITIEKLALETHVSC